VELILIILGLWIAYSVLKAVFGDNGRNERTGSGSDQTTRASSSQAKKSDTTFRPNRSPRTSPKIDFSTNFGESGGDVSVGSLDGLHDAFTGAPLDRLLGLNQCQSCKVYYHDESLEVLKSENSSQCVACGGAQIVALVAGKESPFKGRNFDPDVISLDNFRDHYNRVITLEARVVAVRVSRRGTDYALMFEKKSWTKGLKLVFFRGSVRKVGGAAFIKGLEGRKVRVRGLLINHRTFGPEIIVSERSMILETK
jgi:hypothetical protein